MQSRKNRTDKKSGTNPYLFSLYIGFFAGLIWGGLKLVEYLMKFTTIVPGFLLNPFVRLSYLKTWQGLIVGWLSFILFSMIAALLYGWLMRKMSGPWYGFGYGVFWWGVLYLLIGPFTGMVPSVTKMDVNTFFTDVCLFVLWGLFIGYSISMEFTDERNREPA